MIVQLATTFEGVALMVTDGGRLFEDCVSVPLCDDCGICSHKETRPVGMARARHTAEVRQRRRWIAPGRGGPVPGLTWATYPVQP